MDLDRLYIPTTLTARINLACSEIKHNISDILERKLKDRLQGKCIGHGYIKPGSVRLVQKSKGIVRPAHSNGQITYDVVYRADLYVPVIGSVVKAKIRNNNKVGILAIHDPLQILVARQGQFNQDIGAFDQYKIGDIVNIRLRKFRFEPNGIYAVGNLESYTMEVDKSYALPPANLDLGQIQINLRASNTLPELNTEAYGDPAILNQKKDKMNPYQKLWEDYIKYFNNPYELLDNEHYNRESIIKFKHEWSRDSKSWVPTGEETGIDYRPFSRAYYKLTEVMHDFTVLEAWQIKPMHIMNLAEGPGGFIQAIIDARGNLASAVEDKYLAITLKKPDAKSKIKDWDSDPKASAYFNIMREKGKKIDTTYGYIPQDGQMVASNGDLTNPEIIRWLTAQYPDGADLITADGGIAVGEDYNYQEMINSKLIYSEIVSAIANQKVGGTFILKVFDIYTDLSVQYLQLLSYFYETINITKPLTSRPANSEKYVVAQGFKGWIGKDKEATVNALLKGLDDWNAMEAENLEPTANFTEQGFFVYGILDIPIDPEYQVRIKENNEEFMRRQMAKIDEGVNWAESGVIKNADFQKNIKTNQKPVALGWCQKYLGESYCNNSISIDTKKITI